MIFFSTIILSLQQWLYVLLPAVQHHIEISVKRLRIQQWPQKICDMHYIHNKIYTSISWHTTTRSARQHWHMLRFHGSQNTQQPEHSEIKQYFLFTKQRTNDFTSKNLTCFSWGSKSRIQLEESPRPYEPIVMTAQPSKDWNTICMLFFWYTSS